MDNKTRICQLIGSIFYYGNFVAETANERELEALLRKDGFFFESEDQLINKLRAAENSGAPEFIAQQPHGAIPPEQTAPRAADVVGNPRGNA